jgi:serine/threonine protein kinase
LGKGAFGRVYLARRTETNDLYALKIVKISDKWGENEFMAIKN